jgi:integrase
VNVAAKKVVTLPVQPEQARPEKQKKVVEADQRAIDRLPPASGEWKIKNCLGLLAWRGTNKTSYRLVRRVAGRLVKRTLTATSLAAAKREAAQVWRELRPRPAAEPVPTLEEALQAYLANKELADRTRADYEAFIRRYLADWLPRRLDLLGLERGAFRRRIAEIARQHGNATAALTLRIFRAIYAWHKRVLPDLPENPAVVCEKPRVRPRDWGMSDAELREWWAAVQAVTPLKRAFWVTLLLTGARRNSVRLLRWQDVDFESRVIHFVHVKGGRSYSVPMSSRLHAILAEWRENSPGEEWVFESPVRPGQPLAEQVKDDRHGVSSSHRLRHSFRTVLARLGAPYEISLALLGHSFGRSVSLGYVTRGLLLEPAREWTEKVSQYYAAVIGWE